MDRLETCQKRREELKKLTDEQLRERFWELCDKVVQPMTEFARQHTSPSIERAVLLRMGIDSVTAKSVVERIHEAGLLGKGAGHVLIKVSEKKRTDVRGAAQAILEDKYVLKKLF